MKVLQSQGDYCLQVPGGKLEVLRELIYKTAVDILFAYRDKVARSAASGQLILPESLKLLPLYALALTKASAFRSAITPSCLPPPIILCGAAWCKIFFLHELKGLQHDLLSLQIGKLPEARLALRRKRQISSQ